MNRRMFTAAIAAAACAPFAAAAQQAGRLHRIGWLDYSSSAENLGVFVQAMAARGWVDGKSFRIEYRGGEGRSERLAAVAVELARLPVDLFVAPGTPEALAARKATATVPIVVAGVDDPVALGLVASLAHPGGNVTGLTNARRERSAKLLSLLREAFPRAASAAVLWDATEPDHAIVLRYFEAAARALDIAIASFKVRSHTEVEPAIASVKKQGGQMLIVPLSSMLVPRWIADLALKYELPLASTAPGYAYEGGLMAFAEDWNEVFERTATFVDRILKGAKPAELPVELPTKFKLIVNARTARTLGISIPQSILIRADNVIG